MYKHEAHEVDEICYDEARKDDTDESESEEDEEKDEEDTFDNDKNDIDEEFDDNDVDDDTMNRTFQNPSQKKYKNVDLFKCKMCDFRAGKINDIKEHKEKTRNWCKICFSIKKSINHPQRKLIHSIR